MNRLPFGIGDFVAQLKEIQKSLPEYKDIDPDNDDQRKAAFARMADVGGGGRYEGKLEKGKTTVRTFNSHTGKFDTTQEIESHGVGDYAFHKAANGDSSYTVTHKPTGLSVRTGMNRKTAEELTRNLHKIKIPTKQDSGFTNPDEKHPGYKRSREAVISAISKVQGGT